MLQEARQSGVEITEDVFRSMIYSFGVKGQADKGYAYLDMMRAAGLKPSIATYGAIINAYADSKMPSEALKAFELMVESGIKVGGVTFAMAGQGCAVSWRGQ